ncbi:hypothetical protein Desor_2894 [Desulfosporosinus orientis DSM 765]|uniref:Uncharacterized protein n=1 Tax=Desulfosporosinus orientis (strain ATCC 19365 / DSM 765 / NCIMB 8382 / VKM B-1628 / Singapore I) TaxID=768706 RepID=G7WFI0_DESOD|nr:hypothetical protein [Desulfosporosinus orientis]AET68423.1 hypothetical protein Desor_2894 [Desulfosporosinus orientis DSM 765]
MAKGQVNKNWLADISTFIESNKGSVSFGEEFAAANTMHNYHCQRNKKSPDPFVYVGFGDFKVFPIMGLE